ncbi:MAG: hypothetical protein JWP12_607 [Bacteroidetes bacterium]|nr:hypothetical protein [Bacteroidota bacterium]
MKYFLPVIIFLLISCNVLAQSDSIPETETTPEETISNATPQTKAMVIDLNNPADVELTLKKIHTFKYLESVILEGETDEATLQKVIYRLSVLKNLSALTLKDNELNKVPENIKGLKTLRSVSIEGNTELDYNDLCNKLSAIPITELKLTDNGLKQDPPAFGAIKSLTKIEITGSDQLNYENLVDELAKLPGLTGLSIPVNYITELPKNITKLKALQLLDVSNNILTDLPSEVSSLKAINNLSIQGNLLLNPVKDLEKFKGNEILYLSLDKEITGDDVEQIKKMFPKAEINYPLEDKDDSSDPAKNNASGSASPKKEVFTGELKAKKEAAILSTAYLAYPALFQSVVYNFDTLTTEERYADLRYSNVYQRVANNSWAAGDLMFRKSSINYEKPGKKTESWFRFYMEDPSASTNYPELRAFQGMYWVYQGELTKKQFRKKFLNKRQRVYIGRNSWFHIKRKAIIRWNDIRVEYDQNNSLFSIQLKCDTGYVKFNAYPVVPGVPIEKSQQQYNRRFVLYQKALLRKSQNFKRNQLNEKRKYDANYKKMQDYAWKELLLRMSDEEKLMSKDEWLDYYDNVIANEKKAIGNAALSRGFVQRALALYGYFSNGTLPVIPKSNSTINGFKTMYIDFIDATGLGKLPVANIMILDNKNKMMYQIPGTLGLSPNMLTLKQFASYSILVELRNGDFGLVTSEEIDRQAADGSKTYQLKTKVIDKNLDTVGELLKGSGIQ